MAAEAIQPAMPEAKPAEAPAQEAKSEKSKTPAQIFAEKRAAKAAAEKPADPPPANSPPPEAQAQEREARKIALLKREAERVAREKAEFARSKEQADGETKAKFDKASKWDAAADAIAKNKPLEALQILGIGYDQLISAELERQQLEANPALKEVRALEARLAEEKRLRQEAELSSTKAEQQRVIDGAVARIESHLKANPEKFEFLNAAGAAKDVFDRIQDLWNKSGQKESISIDDAAMLLESEYEQSWKSIASLKKVQAFFQKAEKPEDKGAPKKSTKDKADEKPVPLSNSNTSGPVARQKLDWKEQRRLAWQQLQGRLNS